jgi:hypothetical protein
MSVRCVAMVTVIMAAGLTAACTSPLALRGARVLEPGELEVIASPKLAVDVVTVVSGDESARERALAPDALFAPEVSVRFGIVDRVDLQLRLDAIALPEVSVGHQLLGDPTRDDDVAMTLTGGLKLSLLSGLEATGLVHVPMQLLIDLPITDVVAVTAGLRVVPSIGVGYLGDSRVGIAAGVLGGVRVKAGAFVFSPELAVAGNAAAGALSYSFVGNNPVPVGYPLVVALGLNVGGQFDFRSKTSPAL